MVDEEKVESDDKLEQDPIVNEENSVSKNTEDKPKEVSKQTDKKQGEKSSKEQEKPTYTCPICKEYSSVKFGSVCAHSRTKHGRNLKLDDEGNIVVIKSKKKKGETEEKENKPLTPYEEVESADEFLRNFLTEFEFNDKFIDLLCRKVKRRNALPYPNELARDIRTMPSGITNPNSADYIADEYGYDFKNYLERLDASKGSHVSSGFDVRSHESYNADYGGFPIRGRRPEPYRGVPLRDHDGGNSPMRDSDRDREDRGRGSKEPDMDQLLTMKDFMMWQLQEENRRLKEEDGRKKPDSEESWIRNRMAKLEDDIHQRDLERMQQLEDEIKEARSTPVLQAPNGPSREEIMQMVERNIEAQSKKLTPDDVERIIRRNMEEYRPGSLTKNDLLYLEAKDKLRLEEKKLDESGKTRNAIGDAIRGGFSHAGQIISRMMTEEGAAGGTQVEGYSNQAENMMQVPCPGCNTIITAPIGSPMVTCPKCGKRWAVEHPGYDQMSPKVEKKEPPVEDFIPKEKEVIQKSMEDVKKDMMKPLEASEPMTDVKKTAENIAIGEDVKKVEEEVKKESFVEKKKKPARKPGNICPICHKKCKNRQGVALHIAEKHPEYKK